VRTSVADAHLCWVLDFVILVENEINAVLPTFTSNVSTKHPTDLLQGSSAFAYSLLTGHAVSAANIKVAREDALKIH
jgi:hypothetical protein